MGAFERSGRWLAAVGVAFLLLVGCGDDIASSTSGAGAPTSGGTGATGAGGEGAANGGGTSTGGSGATGGGGGTTPAGDCAPLPAPTGEIIEVSPAQAGELPGIVSGASAGSTILFADGTYVVSAILQMHTEGVTLRGASGDAAAVVIDGDYAVNELVQITAGNVTLTDLTLTRAIDHPIHASTNGANVDGLRFHRLRLIDGGEQFVKVNPIEGQDFYIDQGTISCSHFELTDAGRPMVESCCGGCYTGGIDIHAAWGWHVRDNTFVDIYCDGGGLAEHAIHFWKGSRDTLVENNTIQNCARGIGFGLGGGGGQRVYPDNPYGDSSFAHYDGIIRNNVVYADIPYYDTGISVEEAREPIILHNTVVEAPGASNAFSSIDFRFAQTVAVIQNNLVTEITQRDGATGTVVNNLEATPFDYFVSPPNDCHLTANATDAIDAGTPHPESGVDIDGETHDAGGSPDLGADEQQ